MEPTLSSYLNLLIVGLQAGVCTGPRITGRLEGIEGNFAGGAAERSRRTDTCVPIIDAAARIGFGQQAGVGITQDGFVGRNYHKNKKARQSEPCRLPDSFQNPR